jgi:hypothetical protein
MTVKEATALVQKKFLKGIGPYGRPEWRCSQESVRELFNWLHEFSTDNMQKLYGSCFGWSEDLPPDIDKVTELTMEQYLEFLRRIDRIKAKHRSIDDEWEEPV